MKKSLLSITVLILFLFCTMTVIKAQTSPQVMAFDVKPDGQLILESDLGAIDVKTAGMNKIDIVVTKEAEKLERGLQAAFTNIDVAEALADFEVTFEQKETSVHIKGEFKRGREHWEEKQGLLSLLTVRFEVTIPYQYNVNLTTSSDDISVADLAGKLRAQTSVGNLHFGEVKGPVSGRTSSNGSIILAGCKSDVDVKTSVGDVNLSNITGGVKAIGGDIQIINVGGEVIAQASSSGSITVKDCQGNVDVKASVGNIDLTNITGGVKAKTGSNGNITLNNCQGEVDVLTSVGNIHTEMTKQPQHGSTLQTSGGGEIVATLISQIALNVDAQTNRGKVSSNLPIQVSKLSKNNLTGTINGGGPLLKLRTSFGDIRLEKR